MGIAGSVSCISNVILILLGRKDEAYRDLKKLLDAGCQPGRLQGFYARLKKKKK